MPIGVRARNGTGVVRKVCAVVSASRVASSAVSLNDVRHAALQTKPTGIRSGGNPHGKRVVLRACASSCARADRCAGTARNGRAARTRRGSFGVSHGFDHRVTARRATRSLANETDRRPERGEATRKALRGCASSSVLLRGPIAVPSRTGTSLLEEEICGRFCVLDGGCQRRVAARRATHCIANETVRHPERYEATRKVCLALFRKLFHAGPSDCLHATPRACCANSAR